MINIDKHHILALIYGLHVRKKVGISVLNKTFSTLWDNMKSSHDYINMEIRVDRGRVLVNAEIVSLRLVHVCTRVVVKIIIFGKLK